MTVLTLGGGVDPLSPAGRIAAVEALRATNDIPVTLQIMGADGETHTVTCHFESMSGETDMNAALLVWTEGKIQEGADPEEVQEYWDSTLRPKWERMACAQSVSPKFVTWEPRGPEEINISILDDDQLTKVYLRIMGGSDTRLNDINPNLLISDEEWDAQFRTLGEAFIITTTLGIPLIEHCWMRAPREERLYALAVYTVGGLYVKKLRKEQTEEGEK